MPIRFHLDEHVHPSIAVGLRRRGVDVTTTNDAGLAGASDDVQLAHATSAGRVTFTQDGDFLRLAAAGVGHAGVVYCKQRTKTIGQIIDFLELIQTCMTEAEMRGHVEFL
jgi:predicted nuclease of predicted toxin-antitoxin system